MRKILIALVTSLATVGTASAQQAPQSPSSVAIQITTVIGQWAQAIETLQKQNADLQKELADTKAKCGQPCGDKK